MDESRKEWHLEKTVSVSHIIATIAAITAFAGAWGNLNTRLSLIEQSIVSYNSENARRDSETKEFKGEIRYSIQNINEKLDRLIERAMKK